jgi:hypothetical protein
MSNRRVAVVPLHKEPYAAPDDVVRILGDLDSMSLLDIITMRPAIQDLEQASSWLSGDWGAFSPVRPLRPIAGQIVNLLTVDQVGILQIRPNG